MKHINPNMVASVLEGIADGERLAGTVGTESAFQAVVEAAQRLHEQLATQVTARIMPSKQLAYNEGFIAAYRAASEHTDDRCECGGDIYTTGRHCRETGTWETRCTGCDHHDY